MLTPHDENLARLDLYRSFKPFSRCLRCNEELEEANRESLNGRVPGEYDRFWTCRQCDHVYWQGSHWRRMHGLVDELEHAAAGSGLGSAIADRVARLHHGEVALLSRAGGGLEARVKLPLRNV
jgi:Mut7-C RNAse domain-containing protein